MNQIEEAITNWWGERCKDFNADCPCCQAWALYDRLNDPISTDKYDKCGRYRCIHCGNIVNLKDPKSNCCIWCRTDLTKDYI